MLLDILRDEIVRIAALSPYRSCSAVKPSGRSRLPVALRGDPRGKSGGGEHRLYIGNRRGLSFDALAVYRRKWDRLCRYAVQPGGRAGETRRLLYEAVSIADDSSLFFRLAGDSRP